MNVYYTVPDSYMILTEYSVHSVFGESLLRTALFSRIEDWYGGHSALSLLTSHEEGITATSFVLRNSTKRKLPDICCKKTSKDHKKCPYSNMQPKINKERKK